ncbi:MAG: HAMP domain-containing sensor histidine kinase [Chitinophagales bacterium]
MNNKLVNAIIIGITVALAGLIFIQVKWIKQSYAVREEKFDQGVYMALSNIEHSIERDEAINYFESSGLNDFGRNMNKMYDTVQTIKTYTPKFTLVDSVGQHAMKFGFSDTSGGFISKFMGSVTYLQEKAEKLHEFNKDKQAFLNDADRERHIIEMQFSKYNRLFQDLAMQFMLDDKCLTSRVNKALIEDLLNKELHKEGINTPYQYAVFDNWASGMLFGNMSVTKEEAQSTNFYSMPLFPNDLYENSGILVLSFPQKSNYIFQSMWLMLSATIAFVFIILASFGGSFYIIYRQKKLDELKTDFINNMTHEFKTPVATISLASQMLKNEKVNTNQEKILNYATIIDEENKRLSGHIENVLQVARLDRGEFKLKIDKININTLLDDIADSMELRIQNENGQLIKNLNAEKPEITGDVFHLTNALYNIFDNAIKYKKEEPLLITVNTRNNYRGVVIQIQDNGIGISKENQKKVFEKFYRVPTGNIHNVKGFGLGLSYVQVILHMHGGDIKLESEPGKGSRFEIFLPFYAVNK